MENLQTHLKNFIDYNIDTPEFTLKNQFLPARLVNIIDGDSIVVILPVFNNYYKYHVRIDGIDTCEMKSKSESNKNLAIKARDELLELITKHKHHSNINKTEIKDILLNDLFIVYLYCKDFDKYGRLLADVYTDQYKTTLISKHLIDKKLAYIYTGETKLTENQQIETLE